MTRTVVDPSALVAILLGAPDAEVYEHALFACRGDCVLSAAGLDYGDCFSYALAKQLGAALLYKGADFDQTDVQSAAYVGT